MIIGMRSHGHEPLPNHSELSGTSERLEATLTLGDTTCFAQHRREDSPMLTLPFAKKLQQKRLEREAYRAGLWVMMQLTSHHDRSRIVTSCYHSGFLWWFMVETSLNRCRQKQITVETMAAVDNALERLLEHTPPLRASGSGLEHVPGTCTHCADCRTDAIALTLMTRGLDPDGQPSAKSSGDLLLEAIRHVRVKFASMLMSLSPFCGTPLLF